MTKDDRQFIINALDDLRQDLKKDIKGNAEGIERNYELIQKIGKQAQKNSLQLKGINDFLFNSAEERKYQFEKLRGDIDDINAKIENYPAMRNTIEIHSRQIGRLQEAAAK
jgi:hypothetical protein